MDSKTIDTGAGNLTEQRLIRLERAVWALVVLLSCVLAAAIVSYMWVSGWSGNVLAIAETSLSGGA